VFKDNSFAALLTRQMDNSRRSDFLKEKYYELSKAYLIALQEEKSTGQLNKLKIQIKQIVAEMDQLETTAKKIQ
jgi:uncharacterized membrane protein